MKKLLLVTMVVGLASFGAVALETPDERATWDYDGCTSVLVTKTASTDGSIMTSHSVDGNYEFRIFVKQAKDSPDGTLRPIYKGGGFGRESEQARIVGELPEVKHTFARFDSSYSFMNEKQLGIGETTFGGKEELYNDEGLLDIMELQRIALERTSTAREAIRLIGDLATKYGYGDRGECLTIIDPKEAWLFEIQGAGPIEVGAVWAAQRIPEGHIGVSANRSRIGEIDLGDPEHFMASANVQSLAKEMGYWDPASGEPFRFNAAYSGPPNIFMCTMREWRVFQLLAPSVKLDPLSPDVPFSVKPDKLVSPRDLMKVHRDYYQGTDYDMTKGLAAGPFASPNRWATRPRPPRDVMGWQRSISIFRCTYAVVLQSRDWLPSWVGGRAWIALDDPKTSVYVPFYAGITRVPEAYQVGGRDKFERQSAFWAFNLVANWAELKYSYMIEDIRAKSTAFEDEFFAQTPEVEAKALELLEIDPEQARQYLTDYSNSTAERTVKAWWDLSEHLIAKYNDGYINLPKTGKPAGYPEQWRDAVGYGKIKLEEQPQQ